MAGESDGGGALLSGEYPAMSRSFRGPKPLLLAISPQVPFTGDRSGAVREYFVTPQNADYLDPYYVVHFATN